MTNENNEIEVIANSALSPFAEALKDVLGLGEKVDGVSLNMLLAMRSLDATFDITYCETFFRAEGKAKTAMIDAAFIDLYPDWKDIVDNATVSVASLKAIKNPNHRAIAQDEKAKAQRKVKAAQNMFRSCVTGLIFLLTEDLQNMKEKNGRLEAISPSGIRYTKHSALTFADVVGFGKEHATEKGWLVQKAQSVNKVQSSGKASKAVSTSETAELATETNGSFPNAFAGMVNALTGLLNVKDLATLSDSEQEALRNLEELIIRKTYGDSKGNIDLDMLTSIYEPVKSSVKMKKTA